MFDKDTKDREKISLYSVHKQMHEVKQAIKENPSQTKGLIRVKDGINLVKNLFLAMELKVEYGNNKRIFVEHKKISIENDKRKGIVVCWKDWSFLLIESKKLHQKKSYRKSISPTLKKWQSFF